MNCDPLKPGYTASMEDQGNEKLLAELQEGLEVDGLNVSDDEARRILVDMRNFAQLTFEIQKSQYVSAQ